MSDNERRKKLMETIKQFNKNQKTEVFTLGNEITDTELIPSGIESVDNFIGGGFKKGAHTIVWGSYSVGKTAIILTTVANAQKLGQNVCYVNTEKPIAPDRFKFFDVNLDDLVYIEAPENAEQALEALRTLCKDKVIDLFIIDSENGLCPKSVQEQKEGQERGLDKKNVAALALTLSNFYNVVNAHVFRSRAAVIWIGQARTKGIGSYFVYQGLSGGTAQEFYAYQIIAMRKGQKANNPSSSYKEYFLDPEDKTKLRYATRKEDIGFSVVMKLDKTNSSKSVKEHQEIEIPYYYDSGFKTPEVKEEPIKIEGTEEEQIKIEQILIDKGILPNPSEIRISKDAKWTQNFTPPGDDLIPENNTQPVEVKEDVEKPSKRRGRPKKESIG